MDNSKSPSVPGFLGADEKRGSKIERGERDPPSTRKKVVSPLVGPPIKSRG